MPSNAPGYGWEAFAFIEELNRLTCPEAVMKATERILAGYGFGQLLIAGLAEERFDEEVLGSGWPAEFMELYTRQRFIRFDPVVRQCRRSSGPFFWHAGLYVDDPEPGVHEVLRCAAEYGITQGFVVPIHAPHGSVAAVSMSGAARDLPDRIKPVLHLIALYAFDRMQQLCSPPNGKPRLTVREREVLAWTAQGKSAWEIGEILAIAKRTVDEHAQTACRKLGAANRTQAVAIALREGIIDV
jgi:LuxR family quorum sensing-dependent transcriptional regulator